MQRPYPPILVGGESEPALRRAARSCDGWVGLGHSLASVAAPVAKLRKLLAEQREAHLVSEKRAAVRPGHFDYTLSGVLLALRDIADCENDVDAFIDTYQGFDLTNPAYATEIAHRLLRGGRAEEALLYLDQGGPNDRNHRFKELDWSDVRIGVLDALGRKVTRYGWGKEIAPGILPVATTGHSIGHTSYVVSSGKSTIYVQSDVTNNPDLFARNPDWAASFDQDPNAAVATRRKVYDMLVAEKLLVQGFHYPFPGVARVEKAGNGYRVVPAPWHPTL